MRNVALLLLVAYISMSAAPDIYASQWKWASFRAYDNQGVRGLAQVCETSDSGDVVSGPVSGSSGGFFDNGKIYVLSINIQNFTTSPIDFNSASFYGVSKATGERFRFSFNRELEKAKGETSFVLKPGGMMVIRGLFPDNGQTTKELFIRLEDGREIGYYNSYHTMAPRLGPKKRRRVTGQ